MAFKKSKLVVYWCAHDQGSKLVQTANEVLSSGDGGGLDVEEVVPF